VSILTSSIYNVSLIHRGDPNFNTVWGIRGTKWHGFQNEPMVLPPDHIIVISCLDLDPRGLNVVFKILMFISAGPLTTGYTDYRTLVHLLPVPFDNVHRLVAIHAHGPCMLPVLSLSSLSSLCILLSMALLIWTSDLTCIRS
jgi:hypothetical protein